MTDSSAFDRLLHETLEIEKTRPDTISAIATRIRAAAGADGNDVLDDQLADLKDKVSADAANEVSDEEADAALELASLKFSEEISNASLERRIAAMMTSNTAEEIGA